MKRLLLLLILMVFANPSHTLAFIPLESRITSTAAESHALLGRLKNALSLTEKRMQEVFGIVPHAKAVVGSSQDVYDFRLMVPDSSLKNTQQDVLLINARVVHGYSLEDLRIAAARSLYPAVWRKFRKPYATEHGLIARLYNEGMIAYAAELIVPRAARWKYSGLLDKNGQEIYGQYLDAERDLASAVLQAIRIGTEGKLLEELFPQEMVVQAPWPVASGRLLSYRIMKAFEKKMDPKMIQLMGFDEFKERLPRCLEVLHNGFGVKNERAPKAP